MSRSTRTLKTTFRRIVARPMLQPFWHAIHELSLIGLNVNIPNAIDETGELQVIDLLATVRGEPIVVFDVGANVGDYSLAAAQRLAGRAAIYAFEPSRRTFQTLQTRVAAHASVRVFNSALGDADGQATLFENSNASGIASVYRRRAVPPQTPEPIAMRRLESLCHECGIEHIDLLKMDVEGHELKVLSGAGALLTAGRIHMIQFEFGGCNVDSRTYLADFFQMLGGQYDLFRILQSGLQPLHAYDEKEEWFVTTNYLARLKSKNPRH